MVEEILSEPLNIYEDRKEALKQKTGTHEKLLPFFKQFEPSSQKFEKDTYRQKAFNTKPAITRTFIWVVTISRIPDRQAKKSRIPSPNFVKSRFPESSQIPNPVKTFCVFQNPAPYFGQIPDPENTLPDSVTCLPKTVAWILSHPRWQFHPSENNRHSFYLYYENSR